MDLSRYRTAASHRVAETQESVFNDVFGVRSHQVLVRDEMVFAPSLNSEELLLDSIKRLRNSFAHLASHQLPRFDVEQDEVAGG